MAADNVSLEQFELKGDFIRRHIGSNEIQLDEICELLGLSAIEDIINSAVPDSILSNAPLSLTETISERAVITNLRKIRERNKVYRSMIGMGYYGTIM
ncbi:MAG: glycine dehydrogenase (aminomethyl-transferring), partial [Gammaproteobacteria bacterium]|nr:glycine dehydrogenase (aminomethyl-transferring) [Gammaproteobacteria bacterium]